MRNKLEAEKREEKKEKGKGDKLTQALDVTREAYQRLWTTCNIVLQAQTDAGKENVPAWFNSLCEVVRVAMQDTERLAESALSSKDDPEASYCRTCGRPISQTTESKAYCEICSRSTKAQTEPIDGGEDHADDDAI